MFEYIPDPCENHKCQNNGTCIKFGNGQYNCDCSTTNYFGERCEKGRTCIWSILVAKIIDCVKHTLHSIINHYILDPCSPNPCKNGNCSKRGKDGYLCNCSSTNYYGVHCESSN